MNIIGVIPARYKSSRFPGKALVDIHGKPMVVRTFEKAKMVKEFDKLLVATDDERIEDVCKKFNIPTMMTSTEHPTGTDRLAEVAEKINGDLYVNIQGDEPLIKKETIAAAISPFITKGLLEFEVTNLYTVIRKHTDLMDSTVPKVVIALDKTAIYLSRLPIPYPKDSRDIKYYKQVCVYGFTPRALAGFAKLKQGPLEKAEGIELLRFIEHNIKVRMVEVEQDTLSVDVPADLELVRKIWPVKVENSNE